MTIKELVDHLTHLVGYACGIDPLSRNLYEVWCGDDAFTLTSVDEVLNEELFDGRALKDIWDDVTEVDF